MIRAASSSLRPVLPSRGPDQAKVFQFSQVAVIDAGGVEQFPPAERPTAAPVRRAAGILAVAVAVLVLGGGQPVLDHPQRQVLVTLGGQDITQASHVGRAEPPVPGG